MFLLYLIGGMIMGWITYYVYRHTICIDEDDSYDGPVLCDICDIEYPYPTIEFMDTGDLMICEFCQK